MTYEIYRYVFIVGAILSLVMLVVTGILFFTLKIPRVIGYLSGSDARKAIKRIQAQSEGGSSVSYTSGIGRTGRSKLTDKISNSGTLHRRSHTGRVGGVRTEKIDTDILVQQAQQSQSAYAAGLEYSGGGTDVLGQEPEEYGGYETTAPETTVLSAGPAMYGQTTLLEQEDPDFIFAVEREITFVHSHVEIS